MIRSWIFVRTVAKLDPNDRGGRKHIYPKFSIELGVENVYTQTFLYQNFRYNTTDRKVWGSNAPSRPFYTSPLSYESLLR
ncbi:hypothetical protein Hanom_Chr12g01161561 [Helianthus anomalus]